MDPQLERGREAWEANRQSRYGDERFERTKRSGIVTKPVYDGLDTADDGRGAWPGEHPFDRGIYPIHYQYQPWMDLQIIGFGTAEQLRGRMDLLHAAGGASGYFGGEAYNIIFDMAGSMGFDPDDPVVRGSVGDCGVSICKTDDFKVLLAGKDLSKTHLSMVCNAGSPAMLALYLAAARDAGFDLATLGGNITNYIWDFFGHCGGVNFAPRASYRLCIDVAAWCATHAPRFNTVTISEHNIAEAGATSVESIGLSIATVVALNEEAQLLGVPLDTIVPRFGFHVRFGEDFFEDIAKVRALRRMYASINRDRFRCEKPSSLQARIHAQTAGSLATAQQPLNNIVRNAYGAMAAALAGVNGMTVNAFDEALGIPTDEAVTLSLRTSQILANETGVTDVSDPLGGSYYIESLTDDVERRAMSLLDDIDGRGGLVSCIESGYVQELVSTSAYRWRQEIDSGDRCMIGVNKFRTEEPRYTQVFQPDADAEAAAIMSVRRHRELRDTARCESALRDLGAACRTLLSGNEVGTVTAHLVDAAAVGATLGEMQGVLFSELGRNK